MIPKAKKYTPPSERSPNAPTKKEIDDLVVDHIGGYTKREIRRLIEIHKHYLNFHYEPQNSDGGLIADDGTDPLYYYQSNLPIIRRMMQQSKVNPDDEEGDDETDADNDEDVESIATTIESRMQELRDGVANNAFVAMEKSRLSKLIAVQKGVARNLQDTAAVVDTLQENKEVFEVDVEERIVGSGPLPLQLDMMYTLLRFRRDQVNQLKRMMQCMSIKVSDLQTAVDSAAPSTAGQRRGAGGRLRLAANAVTTLLRSTGQPKASTEGGGSESDPMDADLVRDLATEVQYLRREQEYMYFRLYGIPKKVEAPKPQPALPNARGPLGVAAAGRAPTQGAIGSTRPGGPQRGPAGAALRANPVEQFHQGPIENHPDYPNFLQRTEKDLRLQMEAQFQSMAEAEAAKLFVSNTKGADALRKLTAELEDHKQMIETMHHQVLGIFESGRFAIKVNRVLEKQELAQHDLLQVVKPLERAVAIRGVKDFETDQSPIGKLLQSFNNRDIEPSLANQTISALDALMNEFIRIGEPIAEEAVDRVGLTLGCAADALKHVGMKAMGAMLTLVSTVAPKAVSSECCEAVTKLMRVMIPQWTEEALTKMAIDISEGQDVYHLAGALMGIKEQSPELRRLLKQQSRGSSKRRLKSSLRDDGSEIQGEEEESADPFPEAHAPFEVELVAEVAERLPSRQRSASSSRRSRSSSALTPVALIPQSHKEVQCELLHYQPPSARSESSDHGPLSNRSNTGSRRRSATPVSARAPEKHGEDSFTQTDVTAMRGCATQTEGGAMSRAGSARAVEGASPISSVHSRPISAMRLPNPMISGDDGAKVPLIPEHGTIAVVSIAGVQRLWLECAGSMPPLIEAYFTLLRDEAVDKKGVELRCDDDAFLVVFASEVNALQWAMSVQHHMMFLPYPPEVLAMQEAAAVPHPAMLEGPTPVASPHTAENTKSAMNFDTTLLQRWVWRGFRLRIALHKGAIQTHDELAVPPSTEDDAEHEVSIGGPHIAFTTKMGLWAPAGATIASSTFVSAIEAQISNNPHLQELATTLSFVKLEEVPAPVSDDVKVGASGIVEGNFGALESLMVIVPEALSHRGSFADDTFEETGGGHIMQRWACGFVHQLESAQRGRHAKLTFIIVEVESAKHFPHHSPSMVAGASQLLITELVRMAKRREGAVFCATGSSFVATFESPLAAAQFSLQAHLTALQFSNYPHELLLVPSCKEQYEDSSLTWRGLRVRTIGHFGNAGLVLRHLQSRELEYFGDAISYANEISSNVPFGCTACTLSFFGEISLHLDLLEDPLVIESLKFPSEICYLLPRPLHRRCQLIQSSEGDASGLIVEPTYSTHMFHISTFDAKRHLPEYGPGIRVALDEQQDREYGVLAVTQHSVLELWKEEEELRDAFEQRLAAALETEASTGKPNRRLPTRKDCREDILKVASEVTDFIEKMVTKEFGGFVAAESKAAFLTNTFVFSSVGVAARCALRLQETLAKAMQSIVPESLRDRLERVFSAETGQIVMDGVRVGSAVHTGRVHLMHSAGCRRWAYYGSALMQAAHVSISYACPGETMLTGSALKALKQCGPADLDGTDAESFLSNDVVIQALQLHMLPPNEEPPRLSGDLLPTTVLSMLPAAQAERRVYFIRKNTDVWTGPKDVRGAAVGSPTQGDNSRNRGRQLYSKYGFTTLKKARDDAAAAADMDELCKPQYLWSAHLAHRVYRAAWRVAVKASRVMGYPLDFDADPTAIDGPLREAVIQAQRIATAYEAGDLNVDHSQVMAMRSILDNASCGVLLRSEENLALVLVALSTRLDRPQAFHRAMQSAIIIPPNEKDDSGLYKGNTDVGPGKRVTPISRPGSRDRSAASTPVGYVSGGTPLLSSLPSAAQLPLTSNTPGLNAMVSVGTENPRFYSAGSKRPGSRQRSATPQTPVLRVEQGTQPSPSDVPALVAMALPNALMVREHHNWASPATLFRPGMGVDIAAMRMKERRIIELEREVERLHESKSHIDDNVDGTFSALKAKLLTDRRSPSPTAQDEDRSAMLLGKLLEWQQNEHAKRGKPLALPPLEPVATMRGTSGGLSSQPYLPRSKPSDTSMDDDGVDFSMHPPPRHGSVDSTVHVVEGDLTALVDITQPSIATIAGAYRQHETTSRHVAVSSRQHWRRPSPLAPLQSSYTMTHADGFLVSGGASSRLDLVAPFSSTTAAAKKTVLPPQRLIKKDRLANTLDNIPHAATHDPLPSDELKTSRQASETTIPSRPQSGDPR